MKATTAGAVLLVVCAPLATWIGPALASHPALVGLVPASVERAGAAIFLALALWMSASGWLARTRLDPAYGAGLAFGLASLTASIFGFDPIPGIAAALVFCVVALAGNRLCNIAEGGAWRELVTAWLWSGIACCLVALAAMLARHPAASFAFAHGRAIGIFENPNELALFTLAFGAVAAGALLAGTRAYAARSLAAVALVVAVLTLFATGSRSGEASFAIGAIALAAMLSRRRVVVAAIALAIVVVVAAAFGVDRRHNPAENASRFAAWHAGIRMVALFPVSGVGVGAYYRVYPVVRAPDAPGPENPIAFDPHDFYLAVAAETGLVGLAAFGWTIVTFVREARGTLARAAPEQRRFGAAILAGLLAAGVHLLFNAFGVAIVLWVVMAALLLGAGRSVPLAAEY